MVFRRLLRTGRSRSQDAGVQEVPVGVGVGSGAETDAAFHRARALARAGDAPGAIAAYREAARVYANAGMPVQAVAAAFEAGWLDPSTESPVREAIEAVRTVGHPIHSASGQSLIGSLDMVCREALVARLHTVSFGTDVLFAREGEACDAVWFVVQGRIRVSRRGFRGGPVTKGLVGPGEVVGESSLLGGGDRIATLVSEVPSDLLELRSSDFRALAKAHPDIRAAFERLQRRGSDRRRDAHVAA